MSLGPVIALVLFVAAYGAVALYARRHRMLAKLATREAARRPAQALLVVGGLMVGTATITAGLVAADSVSDSAIDSFVYRNFGHIDITVTAAGRPFPPAVADALIASPDVQEVTDGIAPGIEVVVSAADLDSRQGAARVTLVGFDPDRQESFGRYTLLTGDSTLGDDLGTDEVLISRLLAEKVGAKTGDRLRVGFESPVGGRERELIVAGIARAQGPGAYTLGPVVFAPLSTAQQVVGIDQINIVRVSAQGGVRDSLDGSALAAPVVAKAAQALDPSLDVREAKATEAENAEQFTVFIRAMLIAMSALVMAGGAALIVNLLGMLAEERRSRLGVLRALGLKRGGLIGLSVIEGALYSVVAGVVGVAVGAVAGRVVAERFGRAFAEFSGENVDFQFFFSLRPGTLIAGFAAGTLLTLAVVLITARRTSRLTITAAIRDLPEPAPDKRRHRWRRSAGLAVATVAGVAGMLLGQPFLRLTGGIAILLVAASLTRRALTPRTHSTLTGLALASWSFVNIAAVSGPEDDAGAFFLVFVVVMLTSVFGLTLAAAANLHLIERAVAVLGGASASLRAVLRPPLAYLARRPLRTGLTTGVFAVIIGMLSLFAVFYIIFQPDYERFGGGYDVRLLSTGAATIELPAALEEDVQDSLLLPTLGYVGPVQSDDEFNSSERLFVPLFEIGDTTPPIRLEQRSDDYATDEEAWAAVAADPRLVVTNFSVPDGELTLTSPDGPISFTVVGSQTFGLVDGVFATSTALSPFDGTPRGATMLLDLDDRTRAEAAARLIESELFAGGIEADAVEALLEDVERGNRAFLSTLDVLIRMGLVVGLLSLSIIGLRIVVERRHVIGVLRSLGYKRRAIMAGLLAEALTTTAIGTGVGVAVGVIMGYLFYRQDEGQSGFGIDLSSLASVLAIVFFGVLLLTVLPAWRAARLPPAEAVRYSE